MAALDEDSTLTQLATAWLLLCAGGEKYQDAFFIFNELSEKFSPSVTLLNSMAVCNMHMDKFPEAENQLGEALQKDPRNPDTLANLIALAYHRKKAPELIARQLGMLDKVAPEHPWLKMIRTAGEAFDRGKGKFAI